MYKKLAIIFLLTFSSAIFSKYDLRKCIILPVTGTADSNLFSQVYEQTENYLKNVKWCYYRPNSTVYDILQKYNDKLDEYLDNQEVLKTLAEKSKTGALIRIQLVSQDIGTKVSFKVIGENGQDIYLRREKLVPYNNPEEISKVASEWLEEYAKEIPFDAQISSIDQLKINTDMGHNIGFKEDMKVKIFRPLGNELHPLLKDVIKWNTKELGSTKLENISETTAEGDDLELLTGEMPVPGDWILSESPRIPYQISQDKSAKPRYGYVSLALDLDNGSQNVTAYNFKNDISGFMFGGYLKGEIWLLENLWSSLELEGRSGSLKSDYYNTTESETRSFFKFKAGYRFLPSESFFGPQIDIYLGYGAYSYQPDYVSLYGPIDAVFSGLIFGLKGSMPFGEKIRAFIEFESIFSSASSDQYSGGTAPGYSLFIGGNYFLKPKFSLDLSIGGYNNTFENLVPGEDVVYKDISLRIGASLFF